jgi:hypothetical protein
MRRVVLAAVFAISTIGLNAQVNGTPPSVLSLGPGRSFAPPPSVLSLAPGRSFAPPASITSLGPNGWTDAPVLLGSPMHFSPRFQRGFGGRRHHLRGGFGGPVFIPYAVPVDPSYYGDYVGAEDDSMQAAPASDNRYGMRGGSEPSVSEDQSRYGTHYLDGRETSANSGIGQHSYSANNGAVNDSAPATSASLEPEPKTVLIFKDGRRMEITNYAIQGNTVFNLSGQGPRRIPLADIDLDATRSANDDLGISFSVP